MLHMQTGAVTMDSSNPYVSIVDRNVFGLRPPPPPAPVETAKPVNVPTITLQGIVNAFGKKQVLFKTMIAARPGEAPKETGLIMSEGERVGDITVLEINEVAGTIKFDNNGTEQIKDITKDIPKQQAGVAAAPAPPPGLPGVPPPRPPGIAQPATPGVPGGSSVTTFGGNAGVTRPIRSNTTGGMAGIGGPGTGAQGEQRPLSNEEQTVLIEVNRKLTEDKVNKGEFPMLPPTELTPQ